MIFERKTGGMRISLEIEASFRGTTYYQVERLDDVDGSTFYEVRCEPSYLRTPSCGVSREETNWRITGDDADELSRMIDNCRMPIVPAFAVGLDGKTTSIRIEQGMNRLKAKWWMEAPAEWADLAEIVAFIRGSRCTVLELRPWEGGL